MDLPLDPFASCKRYLLLDLLYYPPNSSSIQKIQGVRRSTLGSPEAVEVAATRVPADLTGLTGPLGSEAKEKTEGLMDAMDGHVQFTNDSTGFLKSSVWLYDVVCF